MNKKLSVLLLVLLGLLITVQTSFSRVNRKDQASSSSEKYALNRDDEWSLKSQKVTELNDDIALWANQHFEEKAMIVGSISLKEQAALSPVLPLTLVDLVEFTVLRIPKSRRAPGYEKLKLPSFHAVAVLKDSRGDLYSAVVESYDPDKKSFSVQSVGPTLNASLDTISLPLEDRRMKSWPFEDASAQASETGGKLVLIPYPYPMNQIFFQYGDNPSTATLKSIHTGKVYQGLDQVLDEVDAAWQSLH